MILLELQFGSAMSLFRMVASILAIWCEYFGDKNFYGEHFISDEISRWKFFISKFL